MKRALLLTLLVSVLMFSSGAGPAKARPSSDSSGAMAQDPQVASTPYTLIAWSELGMHCLDGKDYSIFGVLPP